MLANTLSRTVLIRSLLVSTAAALLVVPRSFADPKTVEICVAETKDPNVEATPNHDAVKVVQELSSRSLADGTVVKAIALTEPTAKALNVRAKAEGCAYSVWITPHGSVFHSSASSVGYPVQISPAVLTPSDPHGQAAADTAADNSTVPENNGIGFDLREAGTRKPLARGFVPDPTVYGKEHRIPYSVYAVVAEKIIAKLATP
jgi:hypothetical protein